MKTIGIVACCQPEKALELKAAILAEDASVNVIIDDESHCMKAESERIALGDMKIGAFNAVERLEEKGADIVAFACTKPHAFLAEVQTEVHAALVDPVEDFKVYAKAILATNTKPKKGFKVGMIGGLGPAATVDLYDKIVKATPAKNDQEHFKLVVEQNPQIPDRTANLLGQGVDPTLALYNCAKRLQKDGCEALIIPCNTAHAFIPYMERHLDIPFINMQQTTMDEIKAKFGEKARIGLLATTGTVQTGIYTKKAEAMGLPIFFPDEEHQKRVMAAIYGPQGAKAGFTDGVCHDDLVSAAEYLVKTYDCNVLILGCTELPLILDEGDFECAGKTVFLIDPTSALARRVARLAMQTNEERGVK